MVVLVPNIIKGVVIKKDVMFITEKYFIVESGGTTDSG